MVIVEYFDPSSLYPLVSSSLLARLPLRNLHWNSTTRPLRSIASLHVELVPHGQAVAHIPPSQSTPDVSYTPESRESTSSRDDASVLRPQLHDRFTTEPKPPPDVVASTSISGPLKERRHQIPGLRQTPYLKIYLLRCEDNDVYKTSARRQLREWIKTHAMSTSPSSNAQENHDAFEWLILHVVLPTAFTASQAAMAGPQAGAGSADRRANSSSRWPGKGASSVLEKVRADFNGSSKSGLDRVAQIRLLPTDIPPHLLPSSMTSSDLRSDEGYIDPELAGSDLVTKLRSLILTSFDRRVGQYEEDIRQRDAQRHLPGWNFCTFFILKEGLARGFESVGLLEDALNGYDELAVGLDAVARDLVSPEGDIGGSTFLPYTDDLRQRAQAAWSTVKRRISRGGRDHADSPDRDHDWHREAETMIPLDDARKKYRDLILSNQISLFDFRCYLFARQMSLLLRQANTATSRAELRRRLSLDHDSFAAGAGGGSDRSRHSPLGRSGGPEDVFTLAELCRRSVQWITSVARIMRADLWAPFNELDETDRTQLTPIVDNLVGSWIVSVVRQILAETSASALPIPVSSSSDTQPSSAKMRSHGGMGQEPKTIMPEPKTIVSPVQRISSRSGQDVHVEPSRPGTLPAGALPPSQPQKRESGLEGLAYYRAELVLLERNALKQLGSVRGWSTDLGGLYDQVLRPSAPMEDVSLDEESSPAGNTADAQRVEAVTLAGVEDRVLYDALQSEEAFYQSYGVLSDRALRLFGVAAKAERMEATLVDLAVLRYRQVDFATAAGYFSRLEPFYTERGWSLVGTSMLQIHAQCLKRLNRQADSIRVLLELIARAVAAEKRSRPRRCDGRRPFQIHETGDCVENDVLIAGGYLADLEAYSKILPRELTVPLTRYFGDPQVEPYPEHFTDRDGFRLRLRISCLLPDQLTIDEVKVRLVATAASQGQDIWLESGGKLIIKRGLNVARVGANAVVPGTYIASQVVLIAGKIHFTHDAFSNVTGPTTPVGSLVSHSGASVSATKSSVIIYHPRPNALAARLERPRHIFLDRPRSVELVISSGWNDVHRAELRVRSASASLRLQTAELEVIDSRVQITARPRPGVLEIGTLPPDSVVHFKLPYATEHDLPEISIKIEIDYTTSQGHFFYANSSTVSVRSPLTIDVQDVFTAEAATFDGTPHFKVQSPSLWTAPLLVFPKQPALIVCKVVRASDLDQKLASDGQASTRLALAVEYQCLDEEIGSVANWTFGDSLKHSPHYQLHYLLVPALRSRLRHDQSPSRLEEIALLGEVNLGPFDGTQWDECLKAVPPDAARDVYNWIRSWYEDHAIVRLSDASAAVPKHVITLPVQVPRVAFVNTVDLVLVGGDGKPLKDDATVTVGHLVAAELQVKHTRAWNGSGREVEPMEFVYEIQADSTTWLVGGRRRSRFYAAENELHRFPVMLLPLRPGSLLLPTVTVQPRANEDDLGQEPSEGAQSHRHPSAVPDTSTSSTIRSETHHLSDAQTVLVLPDIRSTTVRLETDPTNVVATLVDTETRDGTSDEVSSLSSPSTSAPWPWSSMGLDSRA